MLAWALPSNGTARRRPTPPGWAPINFQKHFGVQRLRDFQNDLSDWFQDFPEKCTRQR